MTVSSSWTSEALTFSMTCSGRVAPMIAQAFDPAHWSPERPVRVVLIGTDFEVKVWETLLKIPCGKATTYQAVANQARNHKRGEARRRQRDSRVAGQDGVTLLPEPYPEVRRAVEKLSVRQRAVVYLTYWEDLNESAVAEHLGISAGSVRSHLARARRHLRRGLQEHE